MTDFAEAPRETEEEPPIEPGSFYRDPAWSREAADLKEVARIVRRYEPRVRRHRWRRRHTVARLLVAALFVVLGVVFQEARTVVMFSHLLDTLGVGPGRLMLLIDLTTTVLSESMDVIAGVQLAFLVDDWVRRRP